MDGCAELGVFGDFLSSTCPPIKTCQQRTCMPVQNSGHDLVSYTMSSKQKIQAVMEGDDYKSARCKGQYQQRQKHQHQHHGAKQSLS